MFDDNNLLADTGEYDPFGRLNRVLRDKETPHPYTASVADFSGDSSSTMWAYFNSGVLVLAAGLTLVGCRAPPGERFVLPPGFLGRVSFKYGVPGAPPLPIEDGFFVIRVTGPSDLGRGAGGPGIVIITSDKARLTEWKRTEVYYETTTGRVIANLRMGGGTTTGEDGGDGVIVETIFHPQ